jgi:lauroyl/myristoyl acyltransferase
MPLPALSSWERAASDVLHVIVLGMQRVVGFGGLHAFGRFFGTLEWLINHKRRRRFRKSHARILGRKPKFGEWWPAGMRFAQRVRCNKLYYLIIDAQADKRTAPHLEIRNRELLDEAYARGQGVYLAMSHQGDHHVAGMLLARAGYPIAGVRDPNEGSVKRYVQNRFARVRPDFPWPPVLRTGDFPRDIYRCLQHGKVLMSLMDVTKIRTEQQKAETVTVFGQERRFVTGPLHIAYRCRTPVLQAFIEEGPGYRYTLNVVELLMDPDEVTDVRAAVWSAVTRYAANLEAFMKDRPYLVSRI